MIERQAEELFYEVLARPTPVERARFLETVCDGQSELRARVERLLSAHAQLGPFLKQPPADLRSVCQNLADIPREEPAAHCSPGCLPAQDRPPDICGLRLADRYEIIDVIGEGGMGTVYRATQFTPVRREVAIKVLRRGLESGGVLARFEAERQALALMDHSGIARVYDGGTTPAGEPFFVMELVRGLPITRFCDERRLTVRDRVALMRDVCEAVQHAHQKGIVHRDLKPGNVLVTTEGDRFRPKVIDFGIAKALADAASPENSALTRAGTLVGTPEYMSPEQAGLSIADVDTRSDVYALGVLLCELLAGELPFGRVGPGRSTFDVLKDIRETEPVTPGTLVTRSAHVSELAARRSTHPRALPRLLRGQLDAIVAKCLCKSRATRYATAQELADDLERYLDCRPIRARHEGTLERCARWARRNPLAASLSAGLVLLLIAASVVSSWLALEANRRANAEAAARREGQQQLARAYWSEARALRTSSLPGRRFRALEAIALSAGITGPTRDLADEAAAALCLADLDRESEWPGFPRGTATLAISPRFDRYARADFAGGVSLRSLPADRELASFPVLKSLSDYGGLRFSDDGRLLFVAGKEGKVRTQVFRLDRDRPERVCESSGTWAVASPDGKRLAITRREQIEIWDVDSQCLVATYPLGRSVEQQFFGWHPERELLVIPWDEGWQTLDLETGQLSAWHEAPRRIGAWPAFVPGTDWVLWAWELGTPVQQLFSLRSGTGAAPPFSRHQTSGQVAFVNRRGDLVLSNDWHHTLRIWDPRTGDQLLTRPSQNQNWLVIDPADARIGPEIVGESVRVLRFAPGSEHRRIALHLRAGDGGRAVTSHLNALSPDGRLLVVTTEISLAFIDTQAGVPIGELPIRWGAELGAIGFQNDGTLCTYGVDGWVRWPVEVSGNPAVCRVGAPRRDLPGWASRGEMYANPSLSADGRVIALPGTEPVPGASIIRDPERGAPNSSASGVLVHTGQDVRSVSVSPDGRFVATGLHSPDSEHPLENAAVWDADTLERVATVTTSHLCRVMFSPAGRWLAVYSGAARECQIVRVADWSVVATFTAPSVGVFSPDDQLWSVSGEAGQIVLCEGSSFREFSRLSSPDAQVWEPLFFSPDNSRLYARDRQSGELWFWDLAQIRHGLETLGLAGDWPATPAARQPAVAPAPLRMTLPGKLTLRGTQRDPFPEMPYLEPE